MHIEQVEQLKKEALSGKMNDATELREHICKVIDRTVQATLAAVVDAVPEEQSPQQVQNLPGGREIHSSLISAVVESYNLCRSKTLENIEKMKPNP